ncbi:hypothetical protein DK427_25740 [Methylobacterium radiodurans]|uniref:Uncharacterized protein n=1 Tax=Methylobacterium radiodurans TaxID=2202828 RepID=A0A2U8VY64_9HYPH|nr:hypothetical protein DK427_25740 [Methylobacterium radiodurans]
MRAALPALGPILAAYMVPWRRHVRRIEPMHDGPLLLHLLHAALMASSMMLTWQVYRLRKP